MNQDFEIGTYNQLCSSAVHYYFLGRIAAQFGLNPESVNQFHHAVERAMKAGWVKNNNYSTPHELDRVLRDKGHKLVPLWEEFKTLYLDPSYSRFDTGISNLDKWEQIRYPKDRYSALLKMTSDSLADLLPPTMDTTHTLTVSEIDELMVVLFRTVDYDFSGKMTELCYYSPDATKYYTSQNSFAVPGFQGFKTEAEKMREGR